MTEFEVWCEGSSETCVFFVGRTKANTFQEACDKLVHRESGHYKNYCSASRSIWGCTLYPSYAEANGYRDCKSISLNSERLVLRVEEQTLLDVPYRQNPDNSGIQFPSVEFLADKLRSMVNRMNMERYGR